MKTTDAIAWFEQLAKIEAEGPFLCGNNVTKAVRWITDVGVHSRRRSPPATRSGGAPPDEVEAHFIEELDGWWAMRQAHEGEVEQAIAAENVLAATFRDRPPPDPAPTTPPAVQARLRST